LSSVLIRVTRVPASFTSASIKGVARGVVVISWRGLVPSLSANCSMSQVSLACRHLPSSSHQARSNCGPRRLSGSSDENICATAPEGQTSLRRVASNAGR
jgi:hypothetical protein